MAKLNVAMAWWIFRMADRTGKQVHFRVALAYDMTFVGQRHWPQQGREVTMAVLRATVGALGNGVHNRVSQAPRGLGYGRKSRTLDSDPR